MWAVAAGAAPPLRASPWEVSKMVPREGIEPP